ncbi:hypothetical protein GGU11DRAFT_854086 [Lentinula aff. detonsa]|nr:hypothetical protein GGU11DRAFT_854086 [Lentinula aff. detonsa]
MQQAGQLTPAVWSQIFSASLSSPISPSIFNSDSSSTSTHSANLIPNNTSTNISANLPVSPLSVAQPLSAHSPSAPLSLPSNHLAPSALPPAHPLSTGLSPAISSTLLPAAPTLTTPPVNTPGMLPGPVAPYRSIQMLDSVAGSSTDPNTQRMSGLTSLVSSRLDSSRSNRARRDHAAGMLPRKPRSKAQRKPSLMDGFSVPKIEDCITSALSPAGQPLDVINLSLQGRLPFPSSIQRKEHDLPSNQVFYLHQETSFYNLNEVIGLNFEYPLLPLDTPVDSLLQNISGKIQEKGMMQLPNVGTSPPTFLSSSSLLPIQLLSFSNLGRANSLSKAPRLRAIALRTGTTIKDLVTLHRKEFAVHPAITQRNFLIVNFKFHNERPAVKISLADFGLGLEVIARHHRCLSIRTYATFREDFDALLPHGFLHLFVDEDSLEDHLCEDEGCLLVEEENHLEGSSEEEEAALTANPLPPTSVSSGISPQLPQIVNIPSTRVRERGQPVLWASTWNPPTQRRSTFYAANLTTTFYQESQRAFLRNNPNEISPPLLRLVGLSCESLSQAYLEEVRSSFIAGNFAHLLSPDRHFVIQDGSGNSVTSGRGVETEVIHGALTIFSREHGRWFTPAVENFSTLTTIASTCNEHVSQERLNDLGILGALVALNLVNECPALPLNPLFLLYLIYEGDFDCLTEAAVSEWSPDLRYILRQWINLPPHELPSALFASHFATHHDLQLQTLAQRDPETHRLLGYRMLHNAVIGKLGTSSLEVQAFQKGFRLPVPNGLTFCEIAQCYFQGARWFLSRIYKSLKTFDDIELWLDVNSHEISNEDKERLDSVMDSAPAPYARRDFLFVLKDFFEGRGIPCPTAFQAIISRINPRISLEEAEDDPSFRVRSFCWAVSGAPFLPPGGRELKVILVSDDNQSYMNGQETSRTEALRLGVHSYKTCFQEVRIPISFLIKLLTLEYNSGLEPDNARDAIHFWFFQQTLEAIGSHTFN